MGNIILLLLIYTTNKPDTSHAPRWEEILKNAVKYYQNYIYWFHCTGNVLADPLKVARPRKIPVTCTNAVPFTWNSGVYMSYYAIYTTDSIYRT
jgi:hypothetical protein